MRFKFKEVFEYGLDGNMRPKMPIQVNGAIISTETSFNREGRINGFNPFEYNGFDIEGKMERDILTIRGFWRTE